MYFIGPEPTMNGAEPPLPGMPPLGMGDAATGLPPMPGGMPPGMGDAGVPLGGEVPLPGGCMGSFAALPTGMGMIGGAGMASLPPLDPSLPSLPPLGALGTGAPPMPGMGAMPGMAGAFGTGGCGSGPSSALSAMAEQLQSNLRKLNAMESAEMQAHHQMQARGSRPALRLISAVGPHGTHRGLS